jgi:hypothetical protein
VDLKPIPFPSRDYKLQRALKKDISSLKNKIGITVQATHMAIKK